MLIGFSEVTSPADEWELMKDVRMEGLTGSRPPSDDALRRNRRCCDTASPLALLLLQVQLRVSRLSATLEPEGNGLSLSQCCYRDSSLAAHTAGEPPCKRQQRQGRKASEEVSLIKARFVVSPHPFYYQTPTASCHFPSAPEREAGIHPAEQVMLLH